MDSPFDAIKHLFHHVGRHVRRVLRKKESAQDLKKSLLKETKSVARQLRDPVGEKQHKKAVQYVQRGVRHYNAQRYGDAEHAFREAIRHDSRYALARLYLGNTLYKQHEQDEAVEQWRLAVRAEPGSKAAKAAEEKLGHLSDAQNRATRLLQDRVEEG